MVRPAGAAGSRPAERAFVEGLNNKIRAFRRRAYGLRDEEYFRLKALTPVVPELAEGLLEHIGGVEALVGGQ